MKTVGGYDFVIQTWIKQEQSSAHTPKAKNNGRWSDRGHDGYRMFFEGRTLYSYGYHFPLACLLEGKRIALVNPEKYSVTTCSHQSAVRYALNRADIPWYDVEPRREGFKPDPSYLLQQFKDEFESAKRARDRLAWEHVGLHSLKRARLAYLDFCREFGFPVEFDLTKEDWKALAQRVKLYYDRRQAKQFAKKLLHGKECYA